MNNPSTTRIARISPLPEAKWTEQVRDVFATLEGPSARQSGSQFNIINVLANNAALALPYIEFSKYLLAKSPLNPRLRELVILRALWNSRGEYEWVHHVQMASRLGFSQADVDGIKMGPSADRWNDQEQCVLRIADKACDGEALNDQDWLELQQHFDRKEQLDLLFIAGSYPMMAWIQNSLDLQLEPGMSSDFRPSVDK
jgi:4-carboxymuconolactone decarboxylase